MALPDDVSAVEAVAEAPVVETDQTHLNRLAQAHLKRLLLPGQKIEEIIPADTPANELWQMLDASVHGLHLLESRALRLKPIIGHILILFKNKPSLVKELGYADFSTFMSHGVYDTLGLHRTNAYQGKLAAEKWPDLSPDRYVKIGPKKLDILSKFTKGSDPNSEAWLAAAERMKVPEFQQYVEQRGFLSPGESTGATIIINTNLSVYAAFQEFIHDGRVHSAVGSKAPDRILAAAIQECYVEWIAKSEDEKEEQ